MAPPPPPTETLTWIPYYSVKNGISFLETKNEIRPKQNSRTGPVPIYVLSPVNFSAHPDLNDTPAPSPSSNSPFSTSTRPYPQMMASHPKYHSKSKMNNPQQAQIEPNRASSSTSNFAKLPMPQTWQYCAGHKKKTFFLLTLKLLSTYSKIIRKSKYKYHENIFTQLCKFLF